MLNALLNAISNSMISMNKTLLSFTATFYIWHGRRLWINNSDKCFKRFLMNCLYYFKALYRSAAKINKPNWSHTISRYFSAVCLLWCFNGTTIKKEIKSKKNGMVYERRKQIGRLISWIDALGNFGFSKNVLIQIRMVTWKCFVILKILTSDKCHHCQSQHFSCKWSNFANHLISHNVSG